jgi:hypothetical protein
MNTGAQRTGSESLMRRSLRKCALWITVLLLIASTFAQAQQTLDIRLSTNGTMAGEWYPQIINTGTNYIINNTSYTVGGVGGTSLTFSNVVLDYDPSISATVNVVNNTTNVQTYTLFFSLPVSPIAGGVLMAGSTQGGTTDNNGDGSILSTVGPGSALYFGRIDGVNVLPLFSNLKTITAGSYLSASDTTSAGLPGVTIPYPGGVSSSIGIEHEFSLTPGDAATFSSVFVVQVPEPGSLSLLAIGGLMLLCRRQRRR